MCVQRPVCLPLYLPPLLQDAPWVSAMVGKPSSCCLTLAEGSHFDADDARQMAQLLAEREHVVKCYWVVSAAYKELLLLPLLPLL